MIKVITSTGDNVNSKFDLRFGRAAYFCLVNEETKKITFIQNEHKDAQGGAGTKASEKMIELGVKIIISGHFGPKALEVLEKFNIQMVIDKDDNQKIQNIIDKLEQSN